MYPNVDVIENQIAFIPLLKNVRVCNTPVSVLYADASMQAVRMARQRHHLTSLTIDQ